ncbi:MAG TPA: hypothetical protein VF808_20315 [Ktedonobacterales bacterium]
MDYLPPTEQYPGEPSGRSAPQSSDYPPPYSGPSYTPEGPTNPVPGYAAPLQPYGPPPGPTAPYPYAPQPPYAPPPSQAMAGQPIAYQPLRPASSGSGGAVAVEVIAGIFGLWGIGWMMRGYTSTGVALLVSGLVVNFALFFGLLFFTFGLGLPCLLVADIIVAVISAVNLSNRLKSSAPLL